MIAPAPWDDTLARGIIEDLKPLDGAMLPMLHALQHAFGCVPPEAVPLIAQALNVSRAEVHGVITFYHDFRSRPEPRRVIKLCRAEACQARGAEALAARASGGAVIETAYCLGLCAQGPAALVEGQPVAHLDAARFDALLGGAPVEAVQAGEGA